MENRELKISKEEFIRKYFTYNFEPALDVRYTIDEEVEIADVEIHLYHDDDPKKTFDIWISNCTFKSDFIFRSVRSVNSIIFENCYFEDMVQLIDSPLPNLEMISCTFSYFELAESKLEKFSLYKVTCDSLNLASSVNDLALNNVKVDRLWFSGKEYGNLTLSKSEIRDILKHEDIEDINVKDTPYNNSEINVDRRRISFNDISIDLGNVNTNINLRKIKAKKIELFGRINKDIYVERFILRNIQNEGNLRFHNVRLSKNGSARIVDSRLGKAEFSSVNFGESNYFQIYLSNLTEIITTNTIFPKIIYGRSAVDYLEVKEVYRQLKFAASKQGDRIKELEYEKYEMINYEKAIHGWRNWKDIIILWSNRVTNNHGQDYAITFLWFIPLTVILFTLVKINLGYSFVIGIPRANDISQYLESALNPLHDFSKVYNEPVRDSIGKAKLFDSILKLVSGYLIFQFLRAFRKYVK